MLQRKGFCSTFISIVAVDPRPTVAALKRVHLQTIETLYKQSQTALGHLGLVIHSIKTPAEKDSFEPLVLEVTKAFTMECTDFLASIGFNFGDDELPERIWQTAVQIIDLGILAYSGAHLERFDRRYFNCDMDSILVPNMGGTSSTESSGQQQQEHDKPPSHRGLSNQTNDSSLCHIELRLRRLQCLDSLLGGMEVWVFHQDLTTREDIRLCLLADSETLADLWGPLWKISRGSIPGVIERYEIGNGSLLPWVVDIPSHEGNDAPVQLNPGEVFCHWIANRDWSSEEVMKHQAGLDRNHFTEKDVLLIGAKNCGLELNPNCSYSPASLRDTKTKLMGDGVLRNPGTDRPQRYADSMAVQVQVGALPFVQLGGQVIYKRRAGQNMKTVLVERWRNNKNRNPAELEALCGVEVSLCTKNARRRSLLDLMSTKSLKSYLESVSFDWASAECKDAFFQSLGDCRKFRAFWNERKDWRQSAGDAISLSLDRLEVTGVNTVSGELRAFWTETFEDEMMDMDSTTMEEWIISFPRSELTWTRFLKDTPECLTMAVVNSSCLDLNPRVGWGGRCQNAKGQTEGLNSHRYPFLETAILLNESLIGQLIELDHLRKEKSDDDVFQTWKTSSLPISTRFSLGDQGKLRVYRPSTEWCPVVMKWESPSNQTFQQLTSNAVRGIMLGGRSGGHHQEYIKGSWSCEPMRVLIISERPT
jgi:hypothetical protein